MEGGQCGGWSFVLKAQSSGYGCWKFTQLGRGGGGGGGFFFLAKKPAENKSGVTLLTYVALATLGAVTQVHPVFPMWSSFGGWSGSC